MSTWTTEFNRLLDQKIRILQIETTRASWPVRDLITAVRCRSSILSAERWNRGTVNQLPTLLHGLRRIAKRRYYWRRSIWLWFPDTTDSIRQQWNSLSEHLFSDYRLPTFLHNGWLEADAADSNLGIKILIALGRGRPRREISLPFQLTKKVTKHFFAAPDHLSVPQAIRWAQLQSEGASLPLTKYLFKLLPTARYREQDQATEQFWLDAIRFLIREFGDDPVKDVYREDLPELLDFVFKLKHSSASLLLNLRARETQPLFPEFSFQGRTLRSLRRLKANWRTMLADRIPRLTVLPGPNADDAGAWPATSWKTFYSDESKRYFPGTWTISELLSPNELRVEGAILGHCVGYGGYTKRCQNREISIWSLRKWTPTSSHRVVTIEVDHRSRSIITALGKRNSPPQPEAMQLITKWAVNEKLKLFGEEPTLVN